MIKCIGSNLALAIVVDSGHYMRLFRKKKRIQTRLNHHSFHCSKRLVFCFYCPKF